MSLTVGREYGKRGDGTVMYQGQSGGRYWFVHMRDLFGIFPFGLTSNQVENEIYEL